MGCANIRSKKRGASNLIKLQLRPSLFIKEQGDNFNNEYELSDKIGSGAFSAVFKCNEKSSNTLRAVKIVNKSVLSKQHKNLLNKLQEIQVLKLLDHPNITKLYQAYEDEKSFYLVMEYCPGGELFNRIINKYTFTEPQVANIMHQLLSAVTYFHSKKVIHRDLKPENLLMQTDSEDFNIKVGDFGNSVLFDVKTKISGIFGSLYYIAPEVLGGSYNEKCDEWSCGVILFILLTGRPPFIGKTEFEIINNIKFGAVITEGGPFLRVSREVKEIIHRLLDRNSETRMTAAEALSHPWMKKFLRPELPSETVLERVLKNLGTFTSRVKLKSAIFTFISTQCVSQSEIADLTRAFKLLDQNGDGKVSKEELFSVYKQVIGGPNAEKAVDNIMKQVDIDGSGFIDYSEFIQATLGQEIMLSKQNLEKAFSIFDKDSSGSISASEIAEIFSQGLDGNEEIWQNILKQADKNGDGEVDLKEFQALLFERYNC